MNTFQFRQLLTLISLAASITVFAFVPSERVWATAAFSGAMGVWQRSPDEDKTTVIPKIEDK